MKRNIIFKIVIAFVLTGAVIGLGIFAYRAGISQGMALEPQQFETGQFPAAPYMAYVHPGFHFGGFLAPLFLMLLAFSAIRALVWGGPRHWHHMRAYHGMRPGTGYGHCVPGVPPMFDEWHRQAHHQGSETGDESPDSGESTPE